MKVIFLCFLVYLGSFINVFAGTPVVNAGPNKTIFLPVSQTILNGSATSSGNTITGYLWTEVSGPNSATINSPTNASTLVTSLIQGTYIFKLTATDNLSQTGSSTVTITVTTGPIANAGGNQNITIPTDSVSLNGSGSSDASGTITNYTWTQKSGPNTGIIRTGSSVNTVVAKLIPGTYVFKLVILDNNGNSASDTAVVIVNPHTKPLVNIGPDQVITLPTNSVNVSLVNSTTYNGTVVSSYLWTKLAGPSSYTITTSTASSTSITGLIAGIYTFQLAVKDNADSIGVDTIQILVNPQPHVNPVVSAGSNQVVILPTTTTTLTGTASSPSGATIVSYQWTKLSGPGGGTISTPTNTSTNITGLVAGNYLYQFKATDNFSSSTTSNVQIKVTQGPVAVIKGDTVNYLNNDSLLLDGTGSFTNSGGSAGAFDNGYNTGYDIALGIITSYSWTQLSGPSAVITAPNGPTTLVSQLNLGTYVFKLTVFDDNMFSGYDTISINSSYRPPVAITTGNQGITLPLDSIIADASASYAQAGTITGHLWSKISGPSSYLIEHPISTTTVITNLTQGIYTFQLVVTDSNGNTDTTVFSVLVNAQGTIQTTIIKKKRHSRGKLIQG